MKRKSQQTDSSRKPLIRMIKGRVISSHKMEKTCVVLLELVKKHPIFGKNLRRSRKVMVDDPSLLAREGDMISAIACRPLSKRKRFKIREVITRNTERGISSANTVTNATVEAEEKGIKKEDRGKNLIQKKMEPSRG